MYVYTLTKVKLKIAFMRYAWCTYIHYIQREREIHLIQFRYRIIILYTHFYLYCCQTFYGFKFPNICFTRFDVMIERKCPVSHRNILTEVHYNLQPTNVCIYVLYIIWVQTYVFVVCHFWFYTNHEISSKCCAHNKLQPILNDFQI